MVASTAPAGTGRIGPNAITRVAEALLPQLGASGTRALFAHAGLAAYVDAPPQAMVDEAEVIALHATLRADLGEARARRVAADAGRRTAAYLLAHRIPRPAQALLKVLPARLAAVVLLRAIGGHAWTFAGSGRFSARAGGPGRPVVLQIEHNPLCRGLRTEAPACDFYSAVFQRLFEVLVHPRAQVVETACEARGDPACRFEVRW
jgi:divinyl protochlorophyllide a 8-vinyl-reductase